MNTRHTALAGHKTQTTLWLHTKVQTGVTCCTLCVFKALLLHGSLPEDEQDLSLSLDQGSAEQQLVVNFFLFFIFLSFSVCSLSLLFCVTLLFALFHQLFSADHISFFLTVCVCVCVSQRSDTGISFPSYSVLCGSHTHPCFFSLGSYSQSFGSEYGGGSGA